MKICFLTESSAATRIDRGYSNMRTDLAWTCALKADYISMGLFSQVRDYDYVVIIWPKGEYVVNTVGCPLPHTRTNGYLSQALKANIIEILKEHNKVVCYVQEGPTWLFNDYSLEDQINYYNIMSSSDIIFAHNEYDVKFYKGLFPDKKINILPALIIEDLVKNIIPIKENKTMIGGNFCHWYGGFQSYMMAQNFNNPIYVPTMHAKRDGEEQLDNLHHLPYMNWFLWMKSLSTFRYGMHLMPTVAAGTFSLNCAYFGIPCIGNELVDTQKICHKELSVDVNDLQKIGELIDRLKNDNDFYNQCSSICKENYLKYYHESAFLEKMKSILV
jgi:hypothetical protein